MKVFSTLHDPEFTKDDRCPSVITFLLCGILFKLPRIIFLFSKQIAPCQDVCFKISWCNIDGVVLKCRRGNRTV